MSVQRIGIVGAGTMGTGIAMIACLGGYATKIHDPDLDVLDEAQMTIGDTLALGEGKRWTPEEAESASERLAAAPTLADLGSCDLIVEAVPENLELKREIFVELAHVCRPKTILATNASSLRVTDIGALTPYPERVVGMHFFNPPSLMQLVEVVAAEHSSERALKSTVEVAERMGRTPIRARDLPGFIANRLARPFSLEALRILADGVADAATIDRICRIGGGFRMGPFELLDLIGLDVNLSVARSFYESGGQPQRWRPSPIQEEMVGKGLLGRKGGSGFYDYSGGRHRPKDPEIPVRAPTVNPAELALVDPAAPVILPRMLAQIANEAAFALEDEVGAAADMNTAMRLGFNWPLGPLEFSGLLGAERAVSILNELRVTHGEAYAPAPRLIAEAKFHAS